jgi:type IV pilus assembly protein PilM
MTANVLGIDIGSYAAKVVTLGALSGNRADLLDLGLAQLPSALVLNWEDKPAPARTAISQALKNMVDRLKLNGRYVSVSVSGDSTVVKKITLPLMPPDELEEVIAEEAAPHLPFPLEEINLAHTILATFPEERQMSVLLVAARKQVVRNYVEAMTLARLKPAVLDIDGLALCNAYEFTRPGNRDNVVLVDIGAHKLRLVVLRDGAPMIINGVAGGGQYLTEELAAGLGLSLEEAEAVKFGAEQAPNPGLAAEVVGRVTAGWIAAVKDALALAGQETPGYQAEGLFLSGGGSLISGLAGQFQRRLGLRTELFNPLLNVNYDAEKYDPEYLRYIGPQMAVSFGLALRRVDIQ